MFDVEAQPTRRPPLLADGFPERLPGVTQESLEVEIALRTLLPAFAPGCRILIDPVVEELVRAVGLRSALVAVLACELNGRSFSVIGVPSHVWRNPLTRACMLKVKSIAKAGGHRIVLTQAASLARQPRLSNATLVNASASHRVSNPDRDAVERLLGRRRNVTVADCVRVMRDPCPLTALLALAAQGVLRLGGERHFGFRTRVFA